MTKEYDKTALYWKDFIPIKGSLDYFLRNYDGAKSSPRIDINSAVLMFYNVVLFSITFLEVFKGLERLAR
jgi:hypothetical protein